MNSTSSEIAAWIRQTHGWFCSRELDEALHFDYPADKKLRRVVMKRLYDKKLIERAPDKEGVYRKLTAVSEPVKWWQ